MKLKFYLGSHTEINSNCIKDQNIQPQKHEGYTLHLAMVSWPQHLCCRKATGATIANNLQLLLPESQICLQVGYF